MNGILQIMHQHRGFIVAIGILLLPGLGRAGEPVKVIRVPNHGIQPQAAVDKNGVLHLIYFHGDPGQGDIFYVSSRDSGKHFSRPIRVNSERGTVIAIGNIRGAQMAIGKGGRVHVAWMGSSLARSRAPGNETPMLYTRMSKDKQSFEPDRNVITKAVGLDGGGSVAADEAGNVYVFWHAAEPGKSGEENRHIWLAVSRDEGKSFAPETRADGEDTGVCGCCGMKAFADRKGAIHVLYRSASEAVHRDTYYLTAARDGERFAGERLDAWEIGNCPMSSFSILDSSAGILTAWETDGRVFWGLRGKSALEKTRILPGSDAGSGQKHPVLAANNRGQVLLAWTEGMGWQRGGALAWQVFDSQGVPTSSSGRTSGVPKWSVVSAVALPDDTFLLIY